MLDGQQIPQLGLGVYEMSAQETYDCVKYALQVGYRHIDTAERYENEEACGRAIRDFMSAGPTISFNVSRHRPNALLLVPYMSTLPLTRSRSRGDRHTPERDLPHLQTQDQPDVRARDAGLAWLPQARGRDVF